MHRTASLVGGALLFALGSGIASAQNQSTSPGWYGQIDIGRGDADVGGPGIDRAFAAQGITGTTTFDRHRTGTGLRLGYQFAPNVAVEGAYDYLGKFRYGTTTVAPGIDSISGTHEINAFSLAAVGLLPLQHGFGLYAKAGLADVRTKLRATSALGTTTPATTSDWRASPMIGLGAHLDLNRNLFARAGWERFTNTGVEQTGKGHADMLTLGLGYRF